MDRKIILNLAISLDGYIAGKDGGFDWIVGDGEGKADTEKKFEFPKFLEDVDSVIMGRNCYEQDMHNDFKDKIVYIITSKDMKDYDNVKFIKGDVAKFFLEEKEKEGKGMFLFGGGILIDTFMKADIIDEFIVGIIPTILGNGRKLFFENNPETKLVLEECTVDNGITIMRYTRK
ncbi:dihydrofolate reductase family protein [uncultured Clostridium sp.]|uniref:dihydrofolate reductase family protein n=1 Tax=uncultured Clostridium sp. TaxID=59620 RepID=UPI002616E341|nr:dihydrofolate reductase family protein [uncultured Clostridium sp.]